MLACFWVLKCGRVFLPMCSILSGCECVTSSMCVAPACWYCSIVLMRSSGEVTKCQCFAIVSSPTVQDMLWIFLGSTSLKAPLARKPASPDL